MHFISFLAVSLPFLTPILALPQASSSSSTASMASSTPSPAPNPNGLTLIQQLELAPTAADRLNLLKPEDFVFNFSSKATGQPGVTTGKGGHSVRADRKTFPALIGSGSSVTVGFLGPCGFNTPHVHPRATELNLVVKGSLMTNFIAENGVHKVVNPVGLYEMAVFPQGAVHEEFNPDCTDAVFVASFASEDPGVGTIAEEFFNLDDDVIEAALKVDIIDGAELERFRSLIPANVALGVQACLDKCGIKKRSVK